MSKVEDIETRSQIRYDHEREDGVVLFDVLNHVDGEFFVRVAEVDSNSSYLENIYPVGREVTIVDSVLDGDEMELLDCVEE
jgi:hypothetical protein